MFGNTQRFWQKISTHEKAKGADEGCEEGRKHREAAKTVKYAGMHSKHQKTLLLIGHSIRNRERERERNRATVVRYLTVKCTDEKPDKSSGKYTQTVTVKSGEMLFCFFFFFKSTASIRDN